MEEVDGIILMQLRQVGAEIPTDISNLKGITTEMLVDGCARCINAIKEGSNLPTKLPGGMSARFRVGTQMANAVKDLGYMTEIGYNTFLYSNEADARDLLMWLVERLPKESSDATAEVLGEVALLNRTFSKALARRIESVWTPEPCKSKGYAWRGKGSDWQVEGTSHMVNFEATQLQAPQAGAGGAAAEYYKGCMPFVTSQPPRDTSIAASVVETSANDLSKAKTWQAEWETDGIKSGLSQTDYKAKKATGVATSMANLLRAAMIRSEAEGKKETDMERFLDDFADADIGKDSAFLNQQNLLHSTDEPTGEAAPQAATEEELQQQRDAEMAAEEARVAEIVEKLKALQANIEKLTSGIASLEEKTNQLEKSNGEEEEKYKVRKKVLDFLPEADENIAKLKGVVDASAKRLVAVAGKWEEKRVELLTEIRGLRRSQQDADGVASVQLEKIKGVRGDIKEVAEEAKAKDMVIKSLTSEYETMNKSASRQAYTRRILEIIKNIGKQKDEITKVLGDTRLIQKEFNAVTEKLQRTYMVTDELIFKDAKTDETCRKAYKYLASIHGQCEIMVNTTEATGVITREIRELEEQIELELAKNMDANAQRIGTDLKAIKEENKGLVAQIKSLM